MMKATVNPFTRRVVITAKDSLDEVHLEFETLYDEADFIFNGLEYNAQFTYEDTFTFEVYGRNTDGHMDYTDNLITKIAYEY